MTIIVQLIVIAFLVEAIWETLKMVWQEKKASVDKIGALVVGIIVAFTLNIDIFIAIGLNPIINYVGVVASGILISRGGNFVHDLFKKIEIQK